MLDHLQHVRLVWIPVAMGLIGAVMALRTVLRERRPR